MDLSQSVGPCPICQSCIYESTDTGFLVCEYGHQSQSVWQEEQDDFDANLTGISRRLRRATPTVKLPQISPIVDPYVVSPTTTTLPTISTAMTEVPAVDDLPSVREMPVVRSGDISRYFLALALQHLLRQQTEIIIEHLNLPQGFATRVREVWLRFIGTLKIDYDETPLLANLYEERPSHHQDGEQGIFDDLASILDPSEDYTPDSDATQPTRPPTTATSGNNRAGRNPTLAPGLGLISTLAIIHLTATDCGIALLASDIRRLVLAGVIPLTDTFDRLPANLRKELITLKLNIIFTPSHWVCPSVDRIQSTSQRIALWLAKFGNYWIKPIDTDRLLWRFARELGLPPLKLICLVRPLITRLIPDLQSYVTRSLAINMCPEFAILLMVVLFLRLHYHFEPVTVIQSKVEPRLGFPNLASLLAEWNRRIEATRKFDEWPRVGPGLEEFKWQGLNSYLRYCRRASIFGHKYEESSPVQGEDSQINPSYNESIDERLLIFPSDEFPSPAEPEPLLDKIQVRYFGQLILQRKVIKFMDEILPHQRKRSLLHDEEDDDESVDIVKDSTKPSYYLLLRMCSIVIGISPLEIHNQFTKLMIKLRADFCK